MYSVIYTVNERMNSMNFVTFHEMMGFCLDLAREGYSELMVRDFKGAIIFKDVQIEREIDDAEIAMRESLGENWW